MKFDEVAILLNCHTFEDFPVFHRGDDADSLLASWTALWHPALIANCRRMPTWYRLDDPPTHDLARLLVRPTSETISDADAMARAVTAAGGLVIADQTSREAILQQALSAVGGPPVADPELVADFLALGFAYLLTELLTRQMRYATRVAETPFADNLVAAAEAAVTGDAPTARTQLQSCYDLLSQERNHYYAVDVYLVDLSLLADPLLGSPLVRQLEEPTKSNLILEARLLERIAEREPGSWQRLQEAVGQQRVGLIGGEWSELPLSLLATDTIRRQFESGLQEFQQRLGQRPRVYGRRQFGLAPTLPQILLRLDYSGALHATFDGGRFPEATQSKSRWEGDGQFSIDAITRAPLDATQSATFLNLATSLGESMDMDHIATRGFVHWVGEASPWYHELRRVTRFTPSLGRFVTVDEFFQETYDPGIHDRFKADQYRSPWLVQAAERGDPRPISASIDYWRELVRRQSWLNCSALWLLVEDRPASRAQHAQAEAALDRFSRAPLEKQSTPEDLDIDHQLAQAASGLVAAVLGGQANSPEEESGCTLVNPWGFPRRIGLFPAAVQPAAEPPIYAVEPTPQGPAVVVDVPSMGLTQLNAERSAPRRPRKSPPPLAVENVLRNEFFEAHLDPRTGGLVTLRDYRDRTNRLSQQLACRTPGSAAAGRVPPPSYSTMVGDSLEVLEADSIHGRIQTRGRLTNDAGTTLADFIQTFTLWRGSRVVELQIELQPHEPLGQAPWDSYYACRFAWSNEAAELARGLNDVRVVTGAKRFEAPLFVQIDEGHASTTVLCGGLPFHRRIGRRMLDTMLIAGREQERHFRLGLGLDLKQPFREALAFLAPNVVVPRVGRPGTPSSTWLFHVDARHVLCTLWQPVWNDDRVVGLRLRLNELEGRSGRVNVQSFRPLQSARKIDGLGQTLEICEVDGPRVIVNVSPQEQVEVEALFVEAAAPPDTLTTAAQHDRND